MADITSEDAVPVASFEILCPDCHLPITVGVKARLQHDNLRELVLTPDLTDVWAHSWIHGSGEPL